MSAMLSLNTSFTDPLTCTRYNRNNYLGCIHFIGVALLLLYVGMCFKTLWKKDPSGAQSHRFRSGRYIWITTQAIETDKYVKALVYAQLFFGISVFLGTLILPFTNLLPEVISKDPMQTSLTLAKASIVNLALLFVSIYGLMSPTKPNFHMGTVFQKTRFKRTFLDLFLQSNQAMLKKIEAGIMHHAFKQCFAHKETKEGKDQHEKAEDGVHLHELLLDEDLSGNETLEEKADTLFFYVNPARGIGKNQKSEAIELDDEGKMKSVPSESNEPLDGGFTCEDPPRSMAQLQEENKELREKLAKTEKRLRALESQQSDLGQQCNLG